jgi:hypothetical protein
MRVSCFSSQNQASTTRKITGVLEAGFQSTAYPRVFVVAGCPCLPGVAAFSSPVLDFTAVPPTHRAPSQGDADVLSPSRRSPQA